MKMGKSKLIASIGIGIMLLINLLGCSTKDELSTADANSMESSREAETVSEPAVSMDLDTGTDHQKQEESNMVDERFELLSLVFRLAGHEEYGDEYTEYQQKLVSEFDGFKSHDAVAYVKGLSLGYDAVFNFSVHIFKDGEDFVFIDDIGSLVEDGRWTQQSATDFLPLLNSFYDETGFAEFYQSNIDFYEAETQRFFDNTYSEIDFEWFQSHVDPENLRCIISPSTIRNNYGATVNNTIVYCAVSGDGSAIVHEYCHSFANPIAHKWYEENTEFKKWCDDTIDPVKLPSYGNGQTIAGEYVTRAYNTLYYADHGYALVSLFSAEKANGFPYIEEVYAMITPYEKAEMSDDPIAGILGVPYELGEEQSFSIGDRELRWNILALEEALSLTYLQSEVGNVFGSKTGDVLYVEDSAESNPYLLIDLGETTFQGEEGYRMYSRILIEE